jgi:hypothetical protein
MSLVSQIRRDNNKTKPSCLAVVAALSISVCCFILVVALYQHLVPMANFSPAPAFILSRRKKWLLDVLRKNNP